MDVLSRLLEYLDPTPEIAGERYEAERRKLIRFFEKRKVASAEELADVTFDRVSQKLNEGENIKNIGGYLYATAQLIFLEYLRSSANKEDSLENLLPKTLLFSPPEGGKEKELRLDCLDSCLEDLPLEARDLVIEYYSADRKDRIKVRQEIADRLGVNRAALGNRLQRLRSKLERCIKNCIATKGRDDYLKK